MEKVDRNERKKISERKFEIKKMVVWNIDHPLRELIDSLSILEL